MFNNNNNNNHFTRTLSVLTSARVFMRRRAIPPLCGGAVQALPNIQTTLRDHPHPASRPMTFGHFTSWRADDRGYYTGAWVQDDATTRACAPHGIFFQGTSKEFAKFAKQLVTFLGQIWPAWYYLQGIVAPGRRATALKERAKVARASSCDINVEKQMVL